jgi:hypothetical protein
VLRVLGLHLDPGPCPVDDAPHTTCTSPDYHGTPTVTITVRRPRSLPPVLPVVEETPIAPVTFTSGEYRRGMSRLKGKKTP